MFLGNPKDSVWEDRGTLKGRLGESPPPPKNPITVELHGISP